MFIITQSDEMRDVCQFVLILLLLILFIMLILLTLLILLILLILLLLIWSDRSLSAIRTGAGGGRGAVPTGAFQTTAKEVATPASWEN